MNTNAITINNVTFSYKETFSLAECSIEMPKGAFSFLLGPNGAGKTTLLKLICGLLKTQSGDIYIEGTSIKTMPRRTIAQRIGIIGQESSYVFPFTAEEIVFMGRYPHGGFSMFESKEDEEKVRWAMETTHTLLFRNRSIFTLSGGERRRVEIARVLAQEADILLLDEPSSHLDIKQQRELFKLLHILNKEKGITLFIISHHLNFIREYGEHIFFIKEGNVKKVHDKDMLQYEDNVIAMF